MTRVLQPHISYQVRERLTFCGIPNLCIGYVPGVRNSQNLPKSPLVGCMAQWWNAGLSLANSLSCSWWVTTYVGKTSATSPPTRPAYPFGVEIKAGWLFPFVDKRAGGR